MKRILLLLILPIVARAAGRDEVAATFVEILTRDDIAFTARRVISNEVTPALLFDLRDLTERLDCIGVTKQEWTLVRESVDEVELIADLDATGVLKGASRRTLPVHRHWHIEAKRDGAQWKLVRAQTEERRIAQSMVSAATTRDAEAILDAARHVDRLETIEIYADTLRYAVNLPRLEHAFDLAVDTGDAALQAYTRRARFIAAQGDHDFIRATLPFLERIGREHPSADARIEAWFTIGLGNIFANDSEAALAAYREAAALVHAADDPLRAIKSQHMCTWLLQSKGQLTAALQNGQRFAELSAQYRFDEGELMSLFNVAELHESLSAYEYARDLLLRAARLARHRGQRYLETMALYGAANDELLLENYESAAKLIAQTLDDVDPQWRAAMYLLASRIAMQRGRYEEADALLAKGADGIDPHSGLRAADTPLMQAQRSELRLRAGRIQEALEEATLALPQTKHWSASLEAALQHVQVYLALGRALRASGRNDEAMARLRDALSVVDESGERLFAGQEQSQIALINAVRGAFETMIEMLVEDGQPAEALRVAEQMRARALRELVAHGRIDISASMTAEERARENELEERVIARNREFADRLAAGTADEALKTKLGVARRDLDVFRAEMRIAHPIVARRRVLSDPSVELPESWNGITLIEYVVTESQTIAFVVTRERGVRAVRVPLPRRTLAKEARRFATEVASRSLTYRKSAMELHGMLLAPLGAHLSETLCIIPDVELWTVPFQALIDERGAAVIDRHAVFYAHSLSLARDTTGSASGRGTLLALGNPTIGASARSSVPATFRDVKLGSLLDAENEVRALQELYRKEQSRVYVRDAALETTFKREAPSYRVLHVAAHALVDDAAPMYSAVVLAARQGEAREDGLLEAREVVDLPLSADLAVLSACETGRGRIGAGEGVVGLAWAFFAAGCSTTVVSQWKAESRSTSKLMIEFHRRLLRGDSPAVALRTAQLALRRNAEYRHPFFWAPFVAIGGAGRPALP